jgi:pimeloyl-ACP methyl ester carboxylesterase
VVTETDVELPDGRTLHVYDQAAGAGGGGRLAVVWHHGTPNTGDPPEPLLHDAERLGLRWVSYDRPGYGGSTPHRGRDVASAAADAAAVADALGIERFAVMGHSGGGPHALACAALLPDRVAGAVGVAALAPFDADGLDWFAGMAASGRATLRAAAAGRVALTDYLAATDWDPEEFTPADHEAIGGAWSWLGAVAGKAERGDPAGRLDDELCYVAPWGFDPTRVVAPVLLVHGARDRVAPSAHAAWLASRIRSAELWLRPDDGHISVLDAGVAALTWLREHAGA